MPPKKSTAAAASTAASGSGSASVSASTAGPSRSAPAHDPSSPSAPIERMDDSIFAPHDPDSSTMELDPPSSSTVQSRHDTPGPSTTFIPRSPSPPLPNLRHENFPPEWDEGVDEDEDDEVVATLPIYLSSALHPHLHLFQFPLHTRSLVAPTYAVARGKGITARMKEKAGKVEVEIPVDAGEDVWREDRAKDFGMAHDTIGDASGVEGGYGFGGRDDDGGGGGGKKKKSSKAKEGKKWGEKIRLRSEGVPSATGYYAGVVNEGALHLHPLAQIMQMRTSLNYLDDYDEKARSRRARRDEEDEEEKKEEKPKPAAQGPPIKALRKVEEEGDGSGSIKDFRNKMWRVAKEEAEDTWVPYAWKENEVSCFECDQRDSTELIDKEETVKDALAKLIVPEEKRDRLKCTTKGLDYLKLE